jgi:hypothetical protein
MSHGFVIDGGYVHFENKESLYYSISWIKNHFIIPIHFFFYLDVQRYTFTFLIDKLRDLLHN